MKLKKILCAGILLAPLMALAQTYPGKPVRIMVGANAGGGTDIIARMLAEKMGEALKVGELNLPHGVTVKMDPEVLVAHVTQTRAAVSEGTGDAAGETAPAATNAEATEG